MGYYLFKKRYVLFGATRCGQKTLFVRQKNLLRSGERTNVNLYHSCSVVDRQCRTGSSIARVQNHRRYYLTTEQLTQFRDGKSLGLKVSPYKQDHVSAFCIIELLHALTIALTLRY